MGTEHLILIDKICKHHNVDYTFINSLQEFGLIEVVMVDDHQYITDEQLSHMEKLIRLYYDLGINIEGMDAIRHLQQKIADLQSELNNTKNKLRLFE